MTEREVTQAYEQLQAARSGLVNLFNHTPLLPRLAPIRQRGFDEADAGRADQQLSPWLGVVTAPMNAVQPVIEIRYADQNAFPEPSEMPRLGREPIVADEGFRVDRDGYFYEVSDPTRHPPFKWRLRLYRNGILEWGARLMRFIEDGTVPGQTVVELVHNALAYFGTVYERSGYYGAVGVWVCLDNAEGTHIEGPRNALPPINARPIADPTDLAFRMDTTADYLASGPTASPAFLVQQAMDYLWQAYGWPRCPYFSDDGSYTLR